MRKLSQWVLVALVLCFALTAPAGATGFPAHHGSGVGDENRSPIADIVLNELGASPSDWAKRWVETLKNSWQVPSKRDLFSHHSDHHWVGKWRFDLADFRERFHSYRDHLNDQPVSSGVIPEPATALLLVAGLAALAGVRRRA